MTTLSKDEAIAMAREAGAVFDPRWGVASNIGTATFERFATLCRAPLVAEVERLKKDLSTYDKRIVALSCIAMEDVHELLALQADRDDWKARAEAAEAELARVRALYATPPQPAAQEPTSAVPANAKPEKAKPYAWRNPMNGVVINNDKKERLLCVGAGYPNFSEPLYAAGQQYLKENGK